MMEEWESSLRGDIFSHMVPNLQTPPWRSRGAGVGGSRGVCGSGLSYDGYWRFPLALFESSFVSYYDWYWPHSSLIPREMLIWECSYSYTDAVQINKWPSDSKRSISAKLWQLWDCPHAAPWWGFHSGRPSLIYCLLWARQTPSNGMKLYPRDIKGGCR